MAKNVIALFDRYEDAAAAVHHLEQAGFSHENISVISSGTQAHPHRATRSPVVTGALAGGLTGLIAGLAGIAIPQVAAYIWYAPLITLATGAGLGIWIGSMMRHEPAPVPESLPLEEDMTRFEGDDIVTEGVRRGATVVMAYVDEADMDRAAESLAKSSPQQLNHRTAAMLAHAPSGQQAGAYKQPARAAQVSQNRGARRPTAPMFPIPRRSSIVPLETISGSDEPKIGKSAYDYDRRGAEMSRYRNEPIDRPPLPEALDPRKDPTEPTEPA